MTGFSKEDDDLDDIMGDSLDEDEAPELELDSSRKGKIIILLHLYSRIFTYYYINLKLFKFLIRYYCIYLLSYVFFKRFNK